ncbi:MAG: DUF4375 domain-containing protein, partial [Clostridia bacterium]|nr:DUF4375 domain-containing protein [Clostridia bacterium]
ADKAYDPAKKDDDINRLTDDEKVFFVLYLFNMEVQNGGLCQFFVNSTSVYAPLISDYLDKVGARDHKLLFDDFVKNNKIDLNDLSFFDFEDLSEYETKANAYPFDDFDDALYDLIDLEEFLQTFAETNLQ